MTQEQWSSVLDEFSLFTDKTSAQKNYDNQLKNSEGFEGYAESTESTESTE